MLRKCPTCGSRSLRRSKRHLSEREWPHSFLAPYRCRDCAERFLVISTKSYFLGGLAIAAIAAVILGRHARSILQDSASAPEVSVSAPGAAKDSVKRVETHNPLPEYTLAEVYAQGDAIAKNTAETWKMLEGAAGNGSPAAQYQIGAALREGRGVVQDYERAFHWLQLSAENGNVRAQFELGQMYRAGQGIAVDNVKAYTWFNLSAAGGNPDAIRARDAMLPLLTRSEITEAQRLARRWTEGQSTAAH